MLAAWSSAGLFGYLYSSAGRPLADPSASLRCPAGSYLDHAAEKAAYLNLSRAVHASTWRPDSRLGHGYIGRARGSAYRADKTSTCPRHAH